MVVGDGLIARGFRPYYDTDEQVLIFASGVSNSGNTAAAAFERERQLLLQTLAAHPEKTVVYFSTCSICDPSLQQSPYVHHKLAMEALLRRQQAAYVIFRLSNLAGSSSNPHTFLNYFVQHITTGSFFYLWKNAWRNVLDLDDMVKLCRHIIGLPSLRNQLINIANPVHYPVLQIVQTIEQVMGKKGNYTIVDKTSIPEIDTSLVQQLSATLHLYFPENYLEQLILKYFA